MVDQMKESLEFSKVDPGHGEGEGALGQEAKDDEDDDHLGHGDEGLCDSTSKRKRIQT